MRLKDKVAIITGAGQGIAERFATAGAVVVVDYVGKPDAPNRVDVIHRWRYAAATRKLLIEGR